MTVRVPDGLTTTALPALRAHWLAMAAVGAVACPSGESTRKSVATLDVVLPELVKRKLPAWNLAQAKLGLAGALKAIGKEPARVNTLLKEVLALEGPRHESQRAKARALAGQEASADSKRLHRK